MSAEPAQPLRLVNPDTGEIHDDGCPDCAIRQDELAGLESVIRSQGATITNLKRDKARERQLYANRKTVQELFAYWVKVTGRRPSCKLTADRFDTVRDRLDEGYLPEHIRLAIDYVAAFPYTTKAGRAPTGNRANRFDDLELICRKGSKLERWANLGAGLK